MKKEQRVKYIWKCRECGEEWSSPFKQITCPNCRGTNIDRVGCIVSQDKKKDW